MNWKNCIDSCSLESVSQFASHRFPILICKNGFPSIVFVLDWELFFLWNTTCKLWSVDCANCFFGWLSKRVHFVNVFVTCHRYQTWKLVMDNIFIGNRCIMVQMTFREFQIRKRLEYRVDRLVFDNSFNSGKIRTCTKALLCSRISDWTFRDIGLIRKCIIKSVHWGAKKYFIL